MEKICSHCENEGGRALLSDGTIQQTDCGACGREYSQELCDKYNKDIKKLPEPIEVQIASLDPDLYHIIGINLDIDRLDNVREVIEHCLRGIKCILIPTNNVGMVDVNSLTNDQVKILKEQLK